MSTSCFEDPTVLRYLPTALEALRLGVVVSSEALGTFCNSEAVRMLGLPDPRTPVNGWANFVKFSEANGRPPALVNPLLDSPEKTPVRRKRVQLLHNNGQKFGALLCVFELGPAAKMLLIEDLLWEQPEQREREMWLAAVGHEMRGALQSVMMGASFVSGSNGTPTVRRHVDAIGRNVHLLSRLVEDMTQSALISDGVMHIGAVPVQLRPFLEEATAAAEFTSSDHQLTLDIGASACALADPDRLQQIVTNLLANATKYSAPGKILLRTEVRHAEIVLCLSDEGPGIRMDDQRRLFTRYGRLPSKQEGLGIGLWMCRELARRMGGDMWLRSAPGLGTTFFVALPRHGMTQEIPAVRLEQ